MTAQESLGSIHEDAAISRRGALACVVLGRPRARNAITHAMRERIAAAIPSFARDPAVYALLIRSAVPRVFSSGADLREIGNWARERRMDALETLRCDYALAWLLECFSKPTVSLIDGMVMGSGAGLSSYGTHRVAGEHYAFAMPETAVGFFPDDGHAWVFARLPGHVGLYLGLTGRSVGRADAYRLGLATHCIPGARFTDIETALAAADPVDPILDTLHEDPGEGELTGLRDVIDRCFGAESVEAIAGRLQAEAGRGGPTGGWCAGVLADLRQRSPLSLRVAFRHIREAAHLDLRQTLMIDYRLACRFLDAYDFQEGIRAMLIDKDQRPHWAPSRLDDVSEATVDRFFSFQPGAELVLPTRQEMQAARV